MWHDESIALAHSRLAIVDRPGGYQPMVVSTGTDANVALSYGGEIFNHKELRGELALLGQRFETATDSEVVLRAYLQWGKDFVSRLRGMFAFAIWDSRTRHLLLARDPLGIKPLFYAVLEDRVLFSSEPKGIFAHGYLRPEIDSSGMLELLGTWPYRSPGVAVYRRMHEVRPGERVLVAGGDIVRTRYWRLEPADHRQNSFESAARVREILSEIVSMQKISEMPLSFLISGGLDSAAIAALALQDADDVMRSFSISYDSQSFVPTAMRPSDDSPYVRQMTSFLRSQHSDLELRTSDIVAAEDDATRARDYPDLGDLDCSMLLLFNRVSTDSVVCLSGEGADELFGGYPWYASARSAVRSEFPWQRSLTFPRAFIDPAVAADLGIDDYVRECYLNAAAECPILEQEDSRNASARLASYLDLTRFLPVLLERKDRMSMANGVEVRVPYCDHHLVEYVWNVPVDFKVSDDQRVRKVLLREALAGLIPEDIRSRPKSAYPSSSSPTYEKYLRESLLDALSEDWPMREALNVSHIRAVLSGREAPPHGRFAVWMGRLWSLYRWAAMYRPSVS